MVPPIGTDRPPASPNRHAITKATRLNRRMLPDMVDPRRWLALGVLALLPSTAAADECIRMNVKVMKDASAVAFIGTVVAVEPETSSYEPRTPTVRVTFDVRRMLK